LWLLLPQQRRLTDTNKPADMVSVAYLRAALTANPQDIQLRTKLVNAYLSTGQTQAAWETLQPMLPAKDVQSAYLLYRIQRARFDAAAANDSKRPLLLQNLLTAIADLRQHYQLDNEQQVELARNLLALNQPSEAARIYEHLAQEDIPNRFTWLNEAARWRLASNDPAAAAKDWQLAAAAAPDTSTRLQAIKQAISSEQQVDSRAAYNAIDQALQKSPQDVDLLKLGIDIGLASEHTAQALAWSQQLLSLQPQPQADVLNKHIQVALAAGRPDVAYQAGQKLLQIHPDDPTALHQLAQISEWQGSPSQALRLWQQLQGQDPQAAAQVIRLGNSTYDLDAVRGAWEKLAATRSLTLAEMQAYVSVLDASGEPERAVHVLEGHLQFKKEYRPLWQTLARLQEQRGDLSSAYATWGKIAKHYGRDMQETMSRAALANSLWNFDQALVVLRSLPEPQRNDQYWSKLGDTAWQTQDLPLVMQAYGMLFKHNALTATQTERLINVAALQHDYAVVGMVAKDNWQKQPSADVMIAALSSLADAERWPDVHALLVLTEQNDAPLKDSVVYWRIVGAEAMQNGNAMKAKDAYQKALALAPNDIGVRESLLWLLIQTHEYTELSNRLKSWQVEARNAPALWEVYGNAYLAMAQPRQALFWYSLAAPQHQNDYLWQLDYADVLSATGRAQAALRIRRKALTQLRPMLLAKLQQHQALAKQERIKAQRLIEAQSDLIGSVEAQRWFDALIRRRSEDQADQLATEFAVSWYASRNRPDISRYLLLQAQAKRMQTKAWQELSIALSNRDQVAIEAALQKTQQGNATDTMEAWRRLGHPDKAMQVALNELHSENPDSLNAGFYQQLAELYHELPWYADAKLNRLQFGDLTLTDAQTEYRQSFGRWNMGLQLRHTELDDHGLGLMFELANEDALSLEAIGHSGIGDTTLGLGHIEGALKDFTPWQVQQSFRDDALGNIALYLVHAEQTNDTPLLRALGWRDAFGIRGLWQLDDLNQLQFKGQKQRYQTQEADTLGNGLLIEGRLEHTLWEGPDNARVRLEGSTMHNDAKRDLPATLRGQVDSNIAIQDIVPERYSYLGTGLSFGNEWEDHPLPWELNYRADLGLGWQWPENKAAASFALALGLPIIGRDSFSLYGAVDSSAGAGQNTSRQIGLRYRYFFER
jgi:predicted Zn-dependent protease